MSAPTGNKNAQKWTIEKTDEVLGQIESLSMKVDNYFLTQALEYAGVYPAIWAYWQRIWKHEPDIIHRIRMVELRFHNKLMVETMKGRIKPGMAKFLLENNYGYTSKDDCSSDQMEVLAVVPPCIASEEIPRYEEIREVKPYPSYTPPPPLPKLYEDPEIMFAMTTRPPRTGT